MYFVYIIKSINKKFKYIGHTGNIHKRLESHNQGSTNSTKPFRPFKIIYLEKVKSKTEAIKKEKLYKSYKGGQALKNLILGWGGGVVKHTSL